jgi:hypothetical protein
MRRKMGIAPLCIGQFLAINRAQSVRRAEERPLREVKIEKF